LLYNIVFINLLFIYYIIFNYMDKNDIPKSSSTSSLVQVGEKLLSSFIVCGFNEQNIVRYNPETNPKKYIQYIDIIEKDLGISLDKFEKENEIW